jgi:cytidine deaminase
METAPLTAEDDAVLSHARELNEATVDPGFFDGAHVVAATVRTADGAFHDGVSLPASIGRASSCAEPVAIGSAIAAGYSYDDLEACVAVAYPMPEHDAQETRVIPPCGVCRELLVDYNPEMRVLVPEDGEPRTVAAEELLPVRPW